MNSVWPILIVEDDAGVSFVLTRTLERAGHRVVTASRVSEAQSQTGPWLAAFVDLRLPDGSGLDVVATLAALRPRPFIVAMTAQDTVAHAIDAMTRGADEYLVKPFPLERMHDLVAQAARRSRPVESPPSDGDQYALVGQSSVMRDVYRRIGRAAPTDLPVLIQGETGTGKELVAQAIHAASRRARQPLVAVNVAALPESLVESELFGHERGAFTGAAGARAGAFERADRGTLFLDEIGEMPLSLQPKLLRVLQDGRVVRVGGEHPRVLDVRVLAATNIDLAEAVRRGTFRSDLYFRLRVLAIHLPPLRSREGDVRLLTDHIIAQAASALVGRPVFVSESARTALDSHVWTGNVRELENVLRAALVEASGPELTGDHVRAVLQGGLSAPPTGGAPATPTPPARIDDRRPEPAPRATSNSGWTEPFRRAVRDALSVAGSAPTLLDDAERCLLAEALAVSGGSIVRASQLLGMHRNSFSRRWRALGGAVDEVESSIDGV